MPSFTTIFRATVMLVIGAIAFKGWQLYGPPAEKVKAIAVRALDMVQAAWQNFQAPDKASTPTSEPRGGASPFAQALQPPVADVAISPPALATPTLTPSPPAAVIPSSSGPATQPPITPAAETAAAMDINNDRVKTLMSRLEQLGGADPKLAPWGSSGHLFRCCCQAPLANSPTVSQHFESVAAEPALAVEQVVAKIEAWKTAQRNSGVLRY
jgi:hypothetical protein